MKSQEPKDVKCKKIEWTISNFSTLKIDGQHYSEVFTIYDCPWRLYIQRGYMGNKSLALFLEAYDVLSLPQGSSILAAFSLTVINQIFRKKSLTKGDADVPSKFPEDGYHSWGYDDFMPLNELEDPSRGFISNDKCIVEVEIFWAMFEGFELSRRPKDDDVVDFKDMGKIEKSFVPLLEEVCLWHPSLFDCKNNKSRRFTEWAFNALGQVLQFLKGKKWRDMNEETCEKLQYLWEELEMSRLDLSWLESLVNSALNMKGYAEKAEKVKKLKQSLMVAETEMNMTKEKLVDIERNIEMVRKELVDIKQDFEEKDLEAKIGYG